MLFGTIRLALRQCSASSDCSSLTVLQHSGRQLWPEDLKGLSEIQSEALHEIKEVGRVGYMFGIGEVLAEQIAKSDKQRVTLLISIAISSRSP